jgi:hypothetical protein
LIGDAAEAGENGPRSAAAGEPTVGARAAENAPGEPAAAAGGPISVESYVDAYLRGEGRGDGPRDRELLQFAANNGAAIEEEFTRRAIAGASENPMTRQELEAMMPDGRRQPGGPRDSLWLLAHNGVQNREMGRAGSPAWAVRDTNTGEIVNWTMDKRASQRVIDGQWEPKRFALEKVTPQAAEAELRARVASEARLAAIAGDVRVDDAALKAFDEPGGAGHAQLADSLEHDYRAAAEDPERAKRTYEVDGRVITLADLLDEFDRDRAAVAALRECAA